MRENLRRAIDEHIADLCKVIKPTDFCIKARKFKLDHRLLYAFTESDQQTVEACTTDDRKCLECLDLLKRRPDAAFKFLIKYVFGHQQLHKKLFAVWSDRGVIDAKHEQYVIDQFKKKLRKTYRDCICFAHGGIDEYVRGIDEIFIDNPLKAEPPRTEYLRLYTDLIEWIQEQRAINRAVLIEGGRGSGKTVLLLRICEQWAQISPELFGKIEFVFYVDVGSVMSNYRIRTIFDAAIEYLGRFPLLERFLSKDNIEIIRNYCIGNTLYLIDGVSPYSSNILELNEWFPTIGQRALPPNLNSYIIAADRASRYRIPIQCSRLQLQFEGFTFQKIVQLFYKFFGKNSELITNATLLIGNNKVLRDKCHNAGFVYQMCKVLQCGHQSGKSIDADNVLDNIMRKRSRMPIKRSSFIGCRKCPDTVYSGISFERGTSATRTMPVSRRTANGQRRNLKQFMPLGTADDGDFDCTEPIGASLPYGLDQNQQCQYAARNSLPILEDLVQIIYSASSSTPDKSSTLSHGSFKVKKPLMTHASGCNSETLFRKQYGINTDSLGSKSSIPTIDDEDNDKVIAHSLEETLSIMGTLRDFTTEVHLPPKSVSVHKIDIAVQKVSTNVTAALTITCLESLVIIMRKFSDESFEPVNICSKPITGSFRKEPLRCSGSLNAINEAIVFGRCSVNEKIGNDQNKAGEFQNSLPPMPCDVTVTTKPARRSMHKIKSILKSKPKQPVCQNDPGDNTINAERSTKDKSRARKSKKQGRLRKLFSRRKP